MGSSSLTYGSIIDHYLNLWIPGKILCTYHYNTNSQSRRKLQFFYSLIIIFKNRICIERKSANNIPQSNYQRSQVLQLSSLNTTRKSTNQFPLNPARLLGAGVCMAQRPSSAAHVPGPQWGKKRPERPSNGHRYPHVMLSELVLHSARSSIHHSHQQSLPTATVGPIHRLTGEYKEI